ncbi:MAG: TIM barrel protein [Anaerolineae bacterium]|nr:TIM barrel protein [Anaerolineae bacterium]
MPKGRIPVALQLYTVRDEAAKDFVGTLKKVAALGYAGVELAGTGGLSAREMKTLLGDLGLRCAGSHLGLQVMEGDLAAQLDIYATLGTPYIILPMAPREMYNSEASVLDRGARLNKVAAACKARGLPFAYHNHDVEFRRFGGHYILDILMDNTDPALVKSELDVYWATYAGADPVAWMKKRSGRCPLVHLKDMTPGPERTFAEVGEGIIDFKPIFALCEAQGADWYVVEQDRCARPPLESAALSLRHLREWGIA